MIRILKGYRGRLTNEQFIPPGIYAENDERLFGLADYLVANRHAVAVSDESVIEPPNRKTEVVDTKPAIEDLTVAELKEEATRRGLQFTSKATKAELIALIEGDASEANDGDETT